MSKLMSKFYVAVGSGEYVEYLTCGSEINTKCDYPCLLEAMTLLSRLDEHPEVKLESVVDEAEYINRYKLDGEFALVYSILTNNTKLRDKLLELGVVIPESRGYLVDLEEASVKFKVKVDLVGYKGKYIDLTKYVEYLASINSLTDLTYLVDK